MSKDKPSKPNLPIPGFTPGHPDELTPEEKRHPRIEGPREIQPEPWWLPLKPKTNNPQQ